MKPESLARINPYEAIDLTSEQSLQKPSNYSRLLPYLLKNFISFLVAYIVSLFVYTAAVDGLDRVFLVTIVDWLSIFLTAIIFWLPHAFLAWRYRKLRLINPTFTGIAGGLFLLAGGFAYFAVYRFFPPNWSALLIPRFDALLIGAVPTFSAVAVGVMASLWPNRSSHNQSNATS